MANVKKQSAGSICTLVALVLALVGIVVYYVNIGSAGYFQKAAVPNAVNLAFLGAAGLLVIFVLAQLSLKAAAAKCVEVVAGLLQIASPAALMGSAILLIQSRAQGIAFVYFSNEEVLAEVQTAANLSSTAWAIAAIAVLAVSAIAAVVAAFFRTSK